jgi:hypothetical protein
MICWLSTPIAKDISSFPPFLSQLAIGKVPIAFQLANLSVHCLGLLLITSPSESTSAFLYAQRCDLNSRLVFLFIFMTARHL